ALAIGTPARADDEGDEAKALFAKGRELAKAGNNAEACPLFEQSFKLEAALGTKLNLAICFAATGKLVAAQHLFEQLLLETKDQPQRLQLAREGLEGVKSRVAHLQIDTAALPPGEIVEVDGVPAETAIPIDVDAGHHSIHAAHALPVELEIAEGGLAAVKLEVIVAQPRPRQELYVGGAAAGALAISLITGIAVLNERGSALHHCHDSPTDGSLQCDQRGIDLLDRAHTMAHVSTGFLVAGAALAAFTAVLELKWRRTNEGATATAWTAPHAAGVALEARW
ncbi:MAG: hypothetical protein ABI678_26615, partial [Kofleriaceae bacterium]